MIISKKVIRIGISSLSIAAILVIASLASIGMMQTNNAAAVGNTIEKARFKETFAVASDTIQEGSITTQAYSTAFKSTTGEEEICVFMSRYDASTDTYLLYGGGCGPANELTITEGLNSATFSGTIQAIDLANNEAPFTVTVTVDLTATGQPQTTTSTFHSTSPFGTFVQNEHGMIRDASGSLNISGDFTFSADDADGIIGKARSGFVSILRA